MGGWRLLIMGAVVVSGALTFLVVVAREIERVQASLESHERQASKEFDLRQRQEMEAKAVPPKPHRAA